MLSQMEQEKQNLVMALEMLKQKNFLLERNNENLSMASTMSPLQDRQKRISTHSTTSLVILSLIVLVLGLVTGVGVTSWYNHACSEVDQSYNVDRTHQEKNRLSGGVRQEEEMSDTFEEYLEKSNMLCSQEGV